MQDQADESDHIASLDGADAAALRGARSVPRARRRGADQVRAALPARRARRHPGQRPAQRDHRRELLGRLPALRVPLRGRVRALRGVPRAPARLRRQVRLGGGRAPPHAAHAALGRAPQSRGGPRSTRTDGNPSRVVGHPAWEALLAELDPSAGRVTGLALTRNEARFSLALAEEDGTVELVLAARDDDAPALVRTPSFNVFYTRAEGAFERDAMERLLRSACESIAARDAGRLTLESAQGSGADSHPQACPTTIRMIAPRGRPRRRRGGRAPSPSRPSSRGRRSRSSSSRRCSRSRRCRSRRRRSPRSPPLAASSGAPRPGPARSGGSAGR